MAAPIPRLAPVTIAARPSHARPIRPPTRLDESVDYPSELAPAARGQSLTCVGHPLSFQAGVAPSLVDRYVNCDPSSVRSAPTRRSRAVCEGCAMTDALQGEHAFLRRIVEPSRTAVLTMELQQGIVGPAALFPALVDEVGRTGMLEVVRRVC